MMMMPLLMVVVRGSGQGEEVCFAVAGANDCSTCLDTAAVVAHEGSIYCAKDPDATVAATGNGISYLDSSDDEIDTKWWKNIDSCEPDTNGNCHDDGDDDSSSDDSSSNSKDEEGEDVCYVADDDDCSSCLDTAATVNHEGVLYCAKDPDATVSNNGNGISYTEMDSDEDTNTKWWQNMNLCQPNAKGLCHFDKDDIHSSILLKSNDEDPVTAAVTATEAPADDEVDSVSGNVTATSTSSDKSTYCTSIIDTICTMEDTTVFCDILKNSTTDIPELDDSSIEFTLFVPTDQAFGLVAATIETLSDDEAGRVIAFHIYQGMKLSTNELVCGEKLTSMTTENDQSRTKCQLGGYKYQVGNGNTKHGSLPQILSADTPACNGVVHTLDHVMYPVSLRQLEEGGRQ